jgi:hypothetical protein
LLDGRAGRGESGLNRLRRDRALRDLLRIPVDDEPVRRDLAGDQRFAESPAGFYDYARGVARYGVGGEDHTGRIGGHELLHDDGHGRPFVSKSALLAVVERPLGPERGPALLDEFDAAVGVGRAQVGVI